MCVYHIGVKERGPVVMKMLRGAGPGGCCHRLEAALVFRLHGNSRCLLGAQHLQGGKTKGATVRCRQREETLERHLVSKVLITCCAANRGEVSRLLPLGSLAFFDL